MNIDELNRINKVVEDMDRIKHILDRYEKTELEVEKIRQLTYAADDFFDVQEIFGGSVDLAIDMLTEKLNDLRIELEAV